MSHTHLAIEVRVNRTLIAFEHANQTGFSIKERACIPCDHILCLDLKDCDNQGEADCGRGVDELKVIGDKDLVILQRGQHFLTHTAEVHAGVTVTIDNQPFEFTDAHQTGRTIKERAGIPIADVLFLDRPVEDEVIGDDKKIVLKCGDHFHSSPPANYGGCPPIGATDVGYEPFEKLPQPNGWNFLVIPSFQLPDAFSPRVTRLLIKLPPLFPDAAPDMFWLSPPVRTAAGGAPQGTCMEALLGAEWQRFSWHLLPGAWRVGTSTLRDFMRCIRARLEKRN